MPAATKSLAMALLEVQKNAPSIQKDAINPHFKNRYISLDSLMPQILPVLNAEGLVLTQLPSHIDGVPALTTRITLASTGESIEATVPLMLDRDNSQGLGSAITYTRRYALLSLLALVADTDDDGNKASERTVEIVNKPARRKTGTRKKTAEASGGGEDW